MTRCLCTAILFFLVFTYVVGQVKNSEVRKADLLLRQATEEIKQEYNRNGNYNSPEEKLVRARALYSKNQVQNDSLANVLFELGVIHHARAEKKEAEFKTAVAYYLSSIHLRKKIGATKSEAFPYAYLYLASIYNRRGQADSAEYYQQLGEQYADLLLYQSIYLYGLKGQYYVRTGDCHAAVTYFEKTLDIVVQQKKKYLSKAVQSYSPAQRRTVIQILRANLADAFIRCGRYTEAIGQYKQLLNNHYDQNQILLNLCDAYLKTYHPDSALVYLQEVRLLDNPRQQVRHWNSLGAVYTGMGKHPLALEYYNRAIRLNRQQFWEKNTHLAQSYAGVGKVYEAQNRWPEALSSYQQAIRTLTLKPLGTDYRQNPGDVKDAVSRLDLFTALSQKAAALQKYYLRSKQTPDLIAALQTYQTAIRLAEQLRLSYDTDETKLFFSGQVFPVYEQAIAVAFALSTQTGQAAYMEQAFALSEKSKSVVLAETLRGLRISKQKGVPAGLLQEERNLRRKIAQLTVASLQVTDSLQLVSLRDQLRDQEILLSQLIKKLDANEKYYQLKYNNQPVSIGQLQKRVLDKRTALIEYFYGDKQLYAFVITSDGFRGFRLPTDTIFRRVMADYKTSLFEHRYSPQQNLWAHQLYNYLVLPLRPALQGKSKCIIVPDGQLNYLPFEALVTDTGTDQYLLEDYIIRYAYSGTLLTLGTHADQSNATNGNILAMAPFAARVGQALRSHQISPLPASKQEVQTIGGRIYLESAATKEVFLSMASRSGIIHLATHAKADSRQPLNSYISFYPKATDSLSAYRLYTAELYNLHLDSVKLVVLSACETGGGQLLRGEGVMSLARAFAYAGCSNIAMTLWRAEDQATAQVTTRMYDYLKEGYDKDEALSKAKQDYLRQAPAGRRIPYFWANMVLVGDDKPLYPSYRIYWLGALSILALAIVGWILWQKRKLREVKNQN